jgi:hypothetical protein
MSSFSVEYLAIFRRTDSFCDTSGAFIRLLLVNSEIAIDGGLIRFKNRATCAFQLSHGEITGKGQRFFQLKFTWEGDPDSSVEELPHFLSLLRAVRKVVADTGGEVETLHDDLSSHYAQKAYPLIHDIENLMRRLIANFMLLNVGIEWTVEALPNEVEEAVRNNRRRPTDNEQPEKRENRDYLNILYLLDFIHLGNILFDAYSKKTTTDLYLKLKEAKTVADVSALQDFIPRSNWTRYFAQIIQCDDSYLESRWKKLYLLRCIVAHNAMMTQQQFLEIERLIGEVKPKLLEALGKLPQVTVPLGEVELVAESAARNANAAVGEFVAFWQQMEAAVVRRAEAQGLKGSGTVLSPGYLHERHILHGANIELYDRIRRLRNRIVHGPSPGVPVEEIQAATAGIRTLIEAIETESLIARLTQMSEKERASEIDNIVANSTYEITESEEFAGAQAITNATDFTVDEYEIEDIEIGEDECTVKLTYSASGHQLEDKPYCGDTIAGEAEAVINWEGEVTYQNITAGVDRRGEEE